MTREPSATKSPSPSPRPHPSCRDLELTARPELAEAARVARRMAGGPPTPQDWLVAKLAGDAELERAAAPVFDRAELVAEARIAARMSPGERREAADVAFLESRGAKLICPAP